MWFNPSDFKKTVEDPAAIFAIPAISEAQNSKTAKIATPSLVIPEIENSKIAGIANRSESKNAALSVIDSGPSSKILSVPDEDDRHHCHECRHLRSGYCFKQQFRPVDDIQRRCEDFSGYRHQNKLSTLKVHESSEAEYNARGEFFKWLIVNPGGREFIAVAMPRRTLLETLELFPGAVAIEPVKGEHYDGE
jgi:hypothetical protein